MNVLFTNSPFNSFIMENLSKLWTWLKTLPVWLRAIVLILVSALALIASMSLSACGTTRAVVHNGAHGTSTEIKITTANPTTVTASPNVTLQQDPDK